MHGAAFVVFGVGSPMGTAICHQLRAAGAQVVLVDRLEETIDTLAASLGDMPRLLEDVYGVAQIEHALKLGRVRFGRIHGLIMVSEGEVAGSVVDVPEEAWNTLLGTTLLPLRAAVRAVVPALSREEGVLVIVGCCPGQRRESAQTAIAEACDALVASSIEALRQHRVRLHRIMPLHDEGPLSGTARTAALAVALVGPDAASLPGRAWPAGTDADAISLAIRYGSDGARGSINPR